MDETSASSSAEVKGAGAAGRLVSSATTGMKVRRLLWSVVEGTIFRMTFHTWSGVRANLLRMFGAKIGRRCLIRRTVRVYYPWLLEVGEMCVIGDGANLYNLGKIILGDRVMVSQEAYLCAGSHDYTQLSLPLLTPPVVVEKDAWICVRAFVGPGVRVGEGAVVAAGAVVVKDVEAWMIVGGNPARVIKRRELRGQ